MTRVRVITLGGTISSERSAGVVGSLPRRSGADLVSGLSLPDGVVVDAEAFRLVPSPALTPTDRRELAARIIHIADRGEADAVVISQGTDTIEETAFALDIYGAAADLPVVVTGAMRDASSVSPDGAMNLADAIAVAASGASAGAGVVVVFDGLIHAARWVSKRSTFRSAGFGSEPLGPIGVVTEGRARVWLRPVPMPHLAVDAAAVDALGADAVKVGPAQVNAPAAVAGSRAGAVPRVAVVAASPGDSLDFLDGVRANGYSALVVLGLGAGHVAEAALPVIARVASTIPVVIATRVASGPVLTETYGYAGAEVSLRRAGCILAGALSGAHAAVLVEALQAEGADSRRIAAVFAQFG